MTTTQPRRRTLDADDRQTLSEILALPHIAVLTPAQRIQHAQSKLAEANSNYRGWAMNPTNERALCAARECVLCLQNAVQVLQMAHDEPSAVATEDFPDNLPLDPPECLDEEKAEIAQARKACFATARDTSLSTDSDSMKAAYLDYFQHFGGASRSLWTAAMWRKMTNAILGGVWKSQNGRWVRVHQYTGQITKCAA